MRKSSVQFSSTATSVIQNRQNYMNICLERLHGKSNLLFLDKKNQSVESVLSYQLAGKKSGRTLYFRAY